MRATATGFAPATIEEVRTELGIHGPEAVAERLLGILEAHREDNVSVNLDKEIFVNAMTSMATAGGLLDGIPFGVKDNIDALPFPTTGGCPALQDNVPSRDAPPVALLRAAGGRPVVKLNLHELAFGITSNNGHLGPVRNPHDRSRVAGGSSGGSAAAIALGIIPFALGTDTGGSVRIPASFCGIVEFRPSTGRYPSGGVLTLSTTRDTIGIMGVTVGDVALADAIVSGEANARVTDRPLRFGVPANARSNVCRVVDDALDGALDKLQTAGIQLIAIDISALNEIAGPMGDALVFNEALAFWTQFARKNLDLGFSEFAKQIASPDVHRIFTNLPSLAAGTRPQYRLALQFGRRKLQEDYSRLFANHDLDAIVTATVPVQPPSIGEDETFMSDGQSVPTFSTIGRNVSLASIMGSPSLSIPAAVDRNGLPVGLLIDGAIGHDRLILAVGARLEGILARS